MEEVVLLSHADVCALLSSGVLPNTAAALSLVARGRGYTVVSQPGGEGGPLILRALNRPCDWQFEVGFRVCPAFVRALRACVMSMSGCVM